MSRNRRIQPLAPAFGAGLGGTRTRTVKIRVPGLGTGQAQFDRDVVPKRKFRAIVHGIERDQVAVARKLSLAGRRVADDATFLCKLDEQRSRQLRAQIAKNDASLLERWREQLAALDRAYRAQTGAENSTQSSRATRAIWQDAVLLSMLPLSAVLGQRSRQRQLTLVILLLVWVLGDEMTQLLSGTEASSSEAAPPSWWGYLTPALNVLAGWWLLHDSQREQFVSGIADKFDPISIPRARRAPRPTSPLRRTLNAAMLVVAPCLDQEKLEIIPAGRHQERYRCTVDLAPYVAAGFRLDLIAAGERAAFASVVSLQWTPSGARRQPQVESLAARVTLGELTLELTVSAHRFRTGAPQLVDRVQVAWVVQVLEESTSWC